MIDGDVGEGMTHNDDYNVTKTIPILTDPTQNNKKSRRYRGRKGRLILKKLIIMEKRLF